MAKKEREELLASSSMNTIQQIQGAGKRSMAVRPGITAQNQSRV